MSSLMHSRFVTRSSVVDTGSTDRTVEIAKDLGAKFSTSTGSIILPRRGTSPWISAAANGSSGSMPMTEIIAPQAQSALQQIRDELLERDDVDGAVIPYRTSYAETIPRYAAKVSIASGSRATVSACVGFGRSTSSCPWRRNGSSLDPMPGSSTDLHPTILFKSPGEISTSSKRRLPMGRTWPKCTAFLPTS